MATEQKTPMQLEADCRAAAARGDQQATQEGQAERSTVYTYADGSQRVGMPPFPELSPIEEEQASKRQMANGHTVAPMVVPPGMRTEGAPAPVAGAGITEEEFTAKAQQQLQSDVASGKSPEVVNPTTASTKPQLAGTDGHVSEAMDLGDGGLSTQNADASIDLDKIAADIKPEGDFEATDEQKAAAVAQVAREVGVPVVEDEKPASKKRSTTKK